MVIKVKQTKIKQAAPAKEMNEIKQTVQQVAITQTNTIEHQQANMHDNEVVLAASTDEFSSQRLSRCGEVLRVTREKQGLSIQDIASRLRLSPKQISAIEADNFAALPESTIIKGFIRNYAKLLKIGSEPLIDAYNVLVPSKAPREFAIKPTSNMKVSGYEKPNTGRYIWCGFLILLALGAWLFYQNYVQKPSPTASISSAVDTNPSGQSTTEPLPEPALPAAERDADANLPTQLTLPEAGENVTNANDASTNQILPATNDHTTAVSTDAPAATVVTPAATTTAPATVKLPATITPTLSIPVTPMTPLNTPATSLNTQQNSQFNAAANTLPAASANAAGISKVKLEIDASQETWVNVTDSNAKVIYNKTIFAGSRESIDVAPPINVVVGNAAGASLTMNGKSVDLAPHTHSNVARIKLE